MIPLLYKLSLYLDYTIIRGTHLNFYGSLKLYSTVNPYQQLMCQANTCNLLEVLHFVHCGEEAPGGGADEDSILGSHVKHQRSVGDWDSIHSKLTEVQNNHQNKVDNQDVNRIVPQ